MRLRNEIWVQAYLRQVFAAGAAAYVARRGDGDAGAIFITVRSGDRTRLFAPALPATADDGERRWEERASGAGSGPSQIAERLAREASIDPDIWLIDVEDRDGRDFLGDAAERSPSPGR